MVELALVAPFMLLLIFGIIEFGSAYGQYLDVRHGARESARLASVNYNPDDETSGTAQAADIVAATCNRMDLADDVDVTLELLGSGAGSAAAGEFAEVTVEAPVSQVTGFFGPALDSVDLQSQVEIRLEQDATWASPYTGSC